ncbi:hypothetical protein PTTG_28035 [Puccinia triticina 1-1 BBBD Race 1]|uniref:Thioredoxin domain-containing protein n=1 Tax=Puccinia triticina (isolate 1-1 / race 1 (BBBD)) TaxID=630390 RepID=A0A180GES2_PUCT1|nr:hypothetical protein PTTG_28035 [Puccinia triticina 1-1 BBBD Race 1]
MKLARAIHLLGLLPAALAVQLHAGVQLNENNFDSTIQHGLWFLECYSPFCPHCKHFAPTWIQLVDKMKHYEAEGLKMGQVDCIAQGDLCIRLSVDFYPQMKLYEDGKHVESYNGEKDIPALAKYLEKKVEEYQSKHKKPAEPVATIDPQPAVADQPGSAAQTPVHAEPQHPSPPSPDTHPSVHPAPPAAPLPVSEHPAHTSAPAPQTDTPLKTPNPLGQLVTLDKDNWSSFTKAAPHLPILVQFQTAWCKECRTLVPVWEETARLLKDQANVAQIDCESKWNKEICTVENIRQFPFFVLYHDGTKLDYSGPKVASSMAEFVRKAVATPGSHEITMREFDEALQKKNLFFLFLHSSGTPITVVDAVRTVGKGFLGSAEILKSDSQTIYERLKLPSSHAYLLVFKEYERVPWAKLELEEDAGSPQEREGPRARQQKLTQAVQHWITVHSIPLLAELDQQNVHRVLNSGARKLVVLVALSGIVAQHAHIDLQKSNPKSVALRDEVKLWAVQWRKSQHARAVDMPIDWVWTSYGLLLPRPSDDPKLSSAIIVVDPHHHRYYDRQENGVTLAFKPTSVFQTLLAIEMHKLSGKLAGTFWSRLAWRSHLFVHSMRFMLEPRWIMVWMAVMGLVGYWLKSSHPRRPPGSSSLSPQPAKPFLHASSSDPAPSKPPGFATVFGLNSNVALKAD